MRYNDQNSYFKNSYFKNSYVFTSIWLNYFLHEKRKRFKNIAHSAILNAFIPQIEKLLRKLC